MEMDTHDYDEREFFGFVFYDEDEVPDTPIVRVFLLFKILLVNLVLGCIFTIICFCAKRHIGRCLNYILCGLCDDCDCDYDGSYGSRTAQSRYKIGHTKKYRIFEGEEDTVAYTVLMLVKGFYSNKKLFRKFFAVLIGVLIRISLSTQFVEDLGGVVDKGPVTPAPIHSFSNYTLFSSDTDNRKRVFFVTPTSASGIQNARLVRVAQALYQSRDSVTWVIVSTDPVPSYLWSPHKTEHWGNEQMSMWKGNESRILCHLDHLYETVSRLGIPFVILSGHEIHHKNEKFSGFQSYSRKSLSTFVKANHVGSSWVASTFKSGVYLVGPDEAVYNFNLFREVQGTKLMSSWPTAFDPRYRFSLSTPLIPKNHDVPEGYFVGGRIQMMGIPLQYASYALNIKIAKDFQANKVLWKLTVENVYSSSDLDLKASHIQALAKNCSEIYVWKISSTFTHVSVINQQKIPLKHKWLNTNVPQLHNLINKWFSIDLNLRKII